MSTISDRLRIIKEYIAPWALPKEEVPFHLILDQTSRYDEVRLKLPPNILLKDMFNVGEYKQIDDEIFVNSFKTHGFFGCIIAYDDIFEETHVSRIIEINFYYKGKKVHSKSLKANFYRPRLEFVEGPEEIMISDKVEIEKLLKFKIRVMGFGRVGIKIEGTTGEQFNVSSEPLFREIVRRIATAYRQNNQSESKKSSTEDTSEDNGGKRPARIDSDWIMERTSEYWDRIQEGQYPEDLGDELLIEFRNWLKDPTNAEKIREVISVQIEDIILDSLLFYSERFPADKVDLKFGKPSVEIDIVGDILKMRYRYWDAHENEYSPLEINVSVDDVRKRKKQIDIPVETEWIIEPYYFEEGV